MTRGEPLSLGPFVGGMNTASDPTAISDSELVDCVNMELDVDGSLYSRPPIRETVTLPSWTERIKIIGRGSFPEGNYLIGSNSQGTYAFDGLNWTVVKTVLKSECAVQFFGFMWIVPKPGTAATQKGGKWSPSGGFVQDVSMPEGEAAVFHKTRMFVVPGKSAVLNESRIQFTDPIASSTLSWTSTNIIDVAQGDGQKLIDLIVYNDNLLLFKSDSTYVLAYDIRPTDAILRNINGNIGVSDKRCVVAYENSVFIFHEGIVYEIVNYDFAKMNLKVPFAFDGAVPEGTTRSEEVFICLVGDRLIARYFNRVYVFGLKTRTWTRWESQSGFLGNFGPLLAFPTEAATAVNNKYYAGSTLLEHDRVYRIQDGFDSSVSEGTLTPNEFDIECYIRTKNYDLNDAHHFKRLKWWGADVLTTREIRGAANPVVINFKVSWGQLKTRSWESLNTWGNLVSTPLTVETFVPNSSSLGRLFVKFLKSLRFRQINFELTLKTNGTTSQGPCRVFTLTAIVGSKQTVSKQVN